MVTETVLWNAVQKLTVKRMTSTRRNTTQFSVLICNNAAIIVVLLRDCTIICKPESQNATHSCYLTVTLATSFFFSLHKKNSTVSNLTASEFRRKWVVWLTQHKIEKVMNVLYIINYTVEWVSCTRFTNVTLWKRKKLHFSRLKRHSLRATKLPLLNAYKRNESTSTVQKTCPEKASASCVCSILRWNTAKQALHSRILRLTVFVLASQTRRCSASATNYCHLGSYKGCITVVHCAKPTF